MILTKKAKLPGKSSAKIAGTRANQLSGAFSAISDKPCGLAPPRSTLSERATVTSKRNRKPDVLDAVVQRRASDTELFGGIAKRELVE